MQHLQALTPGKEIQSQVRGCVIVLDLNLMCASRSTCFISAFTNYHIPRRSRHHSCSLEENEHADIASGDRLIDTSLSDDEAADHPIGSNADVTEEESVELNQIRS